MNLTIVASLVLYYVVVMGVGSWVARNGATTNLEGYLRRRSERWSTRSIAFSWALLYRLPEGSAGGSCPCACGIPANKTATSAIGRELKLRITAAALQRCVDHIGLWRQHPIPTVEAHFPGCPPSHDSGRCSLRDSGVPSEQGSRPAGGSFGR